MTAHSSNARRNLVERNIAYWARGWGATPARKAAAVLADHEWRDIVDQELALEPLDQNARTIRLAISRIEHCHESFHANVDAVLDMIASFGRCAAPARAVLDCGAVGAQRRGRVAVYRAALRRWAAGKPRIGDVDRTVAALCGSPDPRKRTLVDHLMAKLEDNGYSRGRDDWTRTESLIDHLECCGVHWERSLLGTLKEIGSGIRTVEFHAAGGWCSCGDAPDRASQAGDLLRDVDAWLAGASPARPVALGERTAVKAWLVASLAKHIRSQMHTGRIVG